MGLILDQYVPAISRIRLPAFPYGTAGANYAIQLAGIQRVSDVNAANVPAAHVAILDVIKDSKYQRHSTFHAFLSPSLGRVWQARLKICPDTIACCVELATDGQGVHATGVHFESYNERKVIIHIQTACKDSLHSFQLSTAVFLFLTQQWMM